MKKYEGMYVFSASLADDVLTQAVDKVKGEITKAGGMIGEAVVLGRRDFARPMKKDVAGSYVRMRFEIDPGAMPQLIARLRLNEHLLRQQMVLAEPVVAPAPQDAKPE